MSKSRKSQDPALDVSRRVGQALNGQMLRRAGVRSESTIVAVATRGRQCGCLSYQGNLNRLINKMWSIHTMEYYSALKNDGNSDHCYCMDETENMIQSEISQMQKDSV